MQHVTGLQKCLLKLGMLVHAFISVLGRLRQEDLKFEASLGDKGRPA
jgi:hypothetical protein